MINFAIFNERPAAILYAALPDGKADIWLRKNIREFAAEEDADGGMIAVSKWAADEAYMRESIALSDIEADFDGAFEQARSWKQGDDENSRLSDDERISQLERDNAELFRQLTDTQLALCELYESLI